MSNRTITALWALQRWQRARGVGETARAAYDEGSCTSLDVLGGILPRRAEIPYTIHHAERID